MQSVTSGKKLIASAFIADRVADQKTVITAFLCEKILAFSLAGDLIDLFKFLVKDKSALTKLQF